MANFRKSTAWFASLFIFLVVGLMSLGTCNSTEQTRDSTQVDETMVTEADESEQTEVPEEEFVDYSQLASESDPDWVKPPYYHDSTASYIPDMYGMIAQNAREDHIGKSFFPIVTPHILLLIHHMFTRQLPHHPIGLTRILVM